MRAYMHWSQWRGKQRYGLDPISFGRAFARAYGALLVAMYVVLVPLWLVAGTPGIVASFLWVPLLMGTTFAVHELAHALAARASGATAAIVASPGYMALAYRPPTQHAARLIAASGPVAGGLCAAIVVAWPHMPWIVAWSASCMVVAHLASLLPLSADGKTVWGRA